MEKQFLVMRTMKTRLSLLILPLMVVLSGAAVQADDYTDPVPPTLTRLTLSNGQNQVSFTPYPSADRFDMWNRSTLNDPWSLDLTGHFSGLSWLAAGEGGSGFYKLQVTPLSSNA